MDHGDNKHCIETPWSDLYYYKPNISGQIIACGVQDNPTRAELFPRSKKYPSLNFELPRQKHEVGTVQRLLQEAYERGKGDQKAAIGKLLRELISL